MFKNALRIAPNNDVFFADLGHLYNAQKKYPEAEAMFKNALRINPNNREVYNVLQDCYKRQGKK